MQSTITKKVAKKTAVKKVSKTSKTKVGSKTTSKKTLVYADSDKAFWLNNGEVLTSLVTLRDALETMEKIVFEHHVTKDKNDFADWVSSVLSDHSCAEDLRKVKTLPSARTVVKRYIKVYNI